MKINIFCYCILTVKSWTVQNWQKWTSSSITSWDKWSIGYTLQSDSCIISLAKATTNTTNTYNGAPISIVYATTGAIAVSNLMSASSLLSLWAMIGQLQIFFILILTRAYIPYDIQYWITGSKFALNLPENIPFSKIEFYQSERNNFNFDLSNNLLSFLGINSNSSIYNLSSSVIMLVLTIIFHVSLLLLFKISFRNEARNWIRWTNVFKWIMNKILHILTFGYYIRASLEMWQYILLSSINELYYINLSGSLRILSFSFAILIIVLFVLFLAFALYLSLSSYKIEENSLNKLSEYFDGIKSGTKYKISVPIQLIRRAAYVALVTVSWKVSQFF